jgi:rhamnosyltransferase
LIAGVTILYHPTADVIANITSYLPALDILYIIDNSDNYDTIIIDSVKKLDKISYKSLKGNNGVAKALNVAAEMAIAGGHQWLLTMDQDSMFTQNGLAHYMDCDNTLSDQQNIALFSPTHVNINSEDRIKDSNDGCRFTLPLKVMTSGNLMNLAVYKEIGKFDEALFVDEVDHEYCYRAHINSKTVVQFDSAELVHSLGNMRRAGHLGLFFKRQRSVYAPIRFYYLFRNYLYVRGKYKSKLPEEFRARDKEIRTFILKNFLFGGNFITRCKYLLQAKRDFKAHKMNKINTAF